MMTAAAPGRIELDVLASRPLIATVEACHADTVMDLSVSGDVVATIDFAGNWAVWHCRDLRRIAGGSVAGRVGRRVAIAPDGRRLAVLTGTEGVDYDWQAAIIDVASGNVAPFGDAGVSRIAWTDAGLIVMGPRGYRLHDSTGRLLVDGHHPPEPGSAWMGSAATRDGSRIYYMGHHRIGGVVVADGSAQPAPDITPFARPSGNAAWAFPDFAVNDDGSLLALGFLDEVLLWRIADGALLARIVPTGVQITDARVRFVGEQLITTFTHVMAHSGQRKTIAAYDVATGGITDSLSTTPEFHGSKGGAAGALLVAHGVTLSLVQPRR